MEAIVKPTENKEKLKEYLKPRTQKIEDDEEGFKVEIDDSEKLGRIPGISEYLVDGEKFDGIGGRPVHGVALAKIESRKDAARAFLATVDGYTLYILDSNRDWDVRSLKRYNSEIIELKNKEAAEKFNFDKKINIEEKDFPMSETELLKIYQEFIAH